MCICIFFKPNTVSRAWGLITKTILGRPKEALEAPDEQTDPDADLLMLILRRKDKIYIHHQPEMDIQSFIDKIEHGYEPLPPYQAQIVESYKEPLLGNTNPDSTMEKRKEWTDLPVVTGKWLYRCRMWCDFTTK